MKLIIVRHGATDHNISRVIQGHMDTPLNKQGLLQAEELGRSLSSQKIERIYSSDLKRARLTTEAILRNNSCNSVEFHRSLRERNYGQFQDGPLKELLQFKHEYSGDWDEYKPQNGESQIEFHSRVGLAWQQIMRESDAETVLFSVHGGVAKSLITHAQKQTMSYRSTLIQDNCCLNILFGDHKTGFAVELLNSVEHLSNPTGLEGL